MVARAEDVGFDLVLLLDVVVLEFLLRGDGRRGRCVYCVSGDVGFTATSRRDWTGRHGFVVRSGNEAGWAIGIEVRVCLNGRWVHLAIAVVVGSGNIEILNFTNELFLGLILGRKDHA